VSCNVQRALKYSLCAKLGSAGLHDTAFVQIPRRSRASHLCSAAGRMTWVTGGAMELRKRRRSHDVHGPEVRKLNSAAWPNCHA
jgi:hypothetical protein